MLYMTVAMILSICAVEAPPASYEQILRDMLERFSAVEQDRSLDAAAMDKALTRIRIEGLEAIDFQELTAAQIDRLTSYVFFTRYEPDYSPQVLNALEPMMQSPDADGAYAATLRANILGRARRGSEESAQASLDAITHSGTRDLFRDERGDSLFLCAARALSLTCPDTGSPRALPAIRVLVESMPHDARVENISHSDELYDKLATHNDAEARTLADSMREHLLQWGRARLDNDAAAVTNRWWAQLRLAFLEHGPTRINLVGSTAPEFDIAWWSDEHSVPARLSDLRGHIVVLDCWASDCGFCKSALAARNEMIEAYRDQPIHFIALAQHQQQFIMCFDTPEVIATPTVAAEAEATLEFRNRYGYQSTFAIVDDADDALVAQYGIRGIPTTIIIDHRGIVRAIEHDPRHPEPTEALLKQILSEMNSL